jgi:hypothetical protein
MNDRKSNNDTLIITKSLKDVMVFYEFIGDRYDVIAPHRNLYFTETFLKSLFAKYTKIIIIYDFDLAELQVQTNLEEVPRQVFVKFVSTKRMTINGKIKVIDKDISDFSVTELKKRLARD